MRASRIMINFYKMTEDNRDVKNKTLDSLNLNTTTNVRDKNVSTIANDDLANKIVQGYIIIKNTNTRYDDNG